MSLATVNSDALRKTMRDFETPLGLATDLASALVLASRGATIEGERAGFLYLALELQDQIDLVREYWARAWRDAGMNGDPR